MKEKERLEMRQKLEINAVEQNEGKIGGRLDKVNIAKLCATL